MHEVVRGSTDTEATPDPHGSPQQVLAPKRKASHTHCARCFGISRIGTRFSGIIIPSWHSATGVADDVLGIGRKMSMGLGKQDCP